MRVGHFGHLGVHGVELVGKPLREGERMLVTIVEQLEGNDEYSTYEDDRTASSGSRMGRFFQNVLSGEAPVAPAEISDLV